MLYRDWQSRLAEKHEILKRKLLDNSKEIAGSPTDCIHITLKKDKEGDTISHIVEKADVVSVIFPPLVDVPIRKIKSEFSNVYQITSLVNAADDNDKFILEIPYGQNVDMDDLIIRVFIDPSTQRPTILALQVIETLGTFGIEMLLSIKYNTTIYADPLPEKLLNTITQMAERRLKIKF